MVSRTATKVEIRDYKPCDWVDQMNRIGERLPFLLEDDEVRSAVKGASRC